MSQKKCLLWREEWKVEVIAGSWTPCSHPPHRVKSTPRAVKVWREQWIIGTYRAKVHMKQMKDHFQLGLCRNPRAGRRNGRGNKGSVAPVEEFFGMEAAANHSQICVIIVHWPEHLNTAALRNVKILSQVNKILTSLRWSDCQQYSSLTAINWWARTSPSCLLRWAGGSISVYSHLTQSLSCPVWHQLRLHDPERCAKPKCATKSWWWNWNRSSVTWPACVVFG